MALSPKFGVLFLVTTDGTTSVMKGVSVRGGDWAMGRNYVRLPHVC
jgi:hypothetical protein